jgi:hypothetical protein
MLGHFLFVFGATVCSPPLPSPHDACSSQNLGRSDGGKTQNLNFLQNVCNDFDYISVLRGDYVPNFVSGIQENYSKQIRDSKTKSQFPLNYLLEGKNSKLSLNCNIKEINIHISHEM